ncbi:MAG: flagellar hook capping FlgD N-terminal domain-containing protein [Pseudomonadota bacterium]
MDAVSGATANTTQTTATTQSSSTTINSDFDTFLKMLTAQLTNQDPLNPLDSQDFAVQLATFSSVEQQTKTNDLLTDLTESFAAANMSQMASWVGRDARTTAAAAFNGEPLVLYPDIPDTASATELVVRDSSGSIVDRRSFAPTAAELVWDGTDDEGNSLASGHYSFEVQVTNSDDTVETATVGHYAQITEVRVTAGAEKLILEGGVEVDHDQVVSIREPLS